MGPKIPRLNLWCFASLSVSCPGGAVIKKKKEKKLRGTIIEHISNLMVAFCKKLDAYRRLLGLLLMI